MTQLRVFGEGPSVPATLSGRASRPPHVTATVTSGEAV